MKKTVNIYPSRPIITVNPIIRGVVKAATKDTDTIRKCLIAGAKVEEILTSGRLVRLDMNNYNKDNEVSVAEKKVEEPKKEEKAEEPVKPESAEPDNNDDDSDKKDEATDLDALTEAIANNMDGVDISEQSEDDDEDKFGM